MDLKPKKQLWLETHLKKLYEKVNSLQPGEKVTKSRPLVTVIHKKGFPKRKADSDTEKKKGFPKQKADSDTEKLSSSKKQKKCPSENSDDPSEEDSIKENSEVFWDFVDDYILSRSFHARTKKGFFNSMNIPSTVNYSVWKNIDFLRHQLSSMDEESALALKIFIKVQKARMNKSAEEISREVIEEEEKSTNFRNVPEVDSSMKTHSHKYGGKTLGQKKCCRV